MSEASVKSVKARLIPAAQGLETEGVRMSGTREPLTEYAGVQAEVARRLGEIVTMLAGAQRGIDETAGVYDSVKTNVNTFQDTVAGAGEDSPQLTLTAASLGGVVTSMESQHGHLCVIRDALDEQVGIMQRVAETLTQQSGITHTIAEEGDRTVATITNSVENIGNWVAVS